MKSQSRNNLIENKFCNDIIEINNNTILEDFIIKDKQLEKKVEITTVNNNFEKKNRNLDNLNNQKINIQLKKVENETEKCKIKINYYNQNIKCEKENKTETVNQNKEIQSKHEFDSLESFLKQHKFENLDNKKSEKKNNDQLNNLENEIKEFENLLEDGRKLMIMFVNNKFGEVLAILETKQNKSMIYQLGAAALYFFDAMLSMDKDKLAKASNAMKFASDAADHQRKKTSYYNYFFNPDYNTFSDIECHAELNYAISQLIAGILIGLEDQSIYGFVNGGFKIRMAYSAFLQCSYILKQKLNWKSKIAKMHFESGTRLGIGAFDLIISFFPSKLAKLLEYVGFHSDRDVAIKELKQAVKLTDGLHYDISSILLCAYYGFLEYFYGLGQSSTNHFDKSAELWNKRTPDSSFVKLGFGIREMMLGNPDKAIDYFKECIESQKFWLQVCYACYWEICWAYVMKSDWKNAAEYSLLLKDNCKWSPAMFTYLHAVFRFMEIENKNKPELLTIISEDLRKIPTLKRKLGGKRAFHEKIVLQRSKKFHNNIENFLLPPFELIYIWNFFSMMANNPKLFEPYLKLIEKKLEIYKKTNNKNKSLDQYCYLIFMKGTIFRHLGKKENSIELFQEILSCKKQIKEETHLLPQSCFELGIIYKEKSNLSEAKKWLKKARDDHSDYITESMIQYRVEWALSLIKKEEKIIQNID